MQLVGNASAKISHLRRKKGLNSALNPLVEEDKNFAQVPPSLFGKEFAQKSKDHIDQVKALPKQRSMHRETIFEGAPPQAWGEEDTVATGGAYRLQNSHNNRQYQKNPAGGKNFQNNKQ